MRERDLAGIRSRFRCDCGDQSYEEQKTDKEKSHKGIWWWECPGSVPGINSGRPRDTRDVWADLCGNSHSRGRMSAGQTGTDDGTDGDMSTGQTGHKPGGVPPKFFMFIGFFFPQISIEPPPPFQATLLKPSLLLRNNVGRWRGSACLQGHEHQSRLINTDQIRAT